MAPNFGDLLRGFAKTTRFCKNRPSREGFLIKFRVHVAPAASVMKQAGCNVRVESTVVRFQNKMRSSLGGFSDEATV